ncbi:hypothetical protein [Bosea sp. TAF32]|uniref:hypothetical protein n=1 Tax=Bosea sp. TAF32 TaxID=3237482 RepID=UPI003F9231F3
MNYIDLGSWGPPLKSEADGVVFARYQNESGDDWYQTVAHAPSRPTGLALCLNTDGQVVFRGDDLDQLNPANSRVVVLTDWTGSVEDKNALFRKVFDLATGEFIDLPPTAPAFVTRGQALMALYKGGLLQPVRDAVAAHPLEEVRIWFENSLNWERYNPYVMAVGMELELTDDQIDDLFIAAALEGV